MPFTCIYCFRSEPAVQPSEAHIFPHVLGGSTSTTDKVCRDCNHRVNQEVEMPVLPAFAFFRSVFGIRGRRNDIVRTRATFKMGSQEGEVFLNERGEPDGVIVRRETDSAGKKVYSIFGPVEKIEAKRQEIAQKFPQIEWKQQNIESREVEVLIEFELDLIGVPLRRLATKVAFERLACRWDSRMLMDHEFDTARNFILTGNEQELCCGLLSDRRLLEGALNFQLPCHAVVLVAHPDDRVLGAVVSFYGLFYYWVLLSTRHKAIAAWDDVLIEDPQARETENPRLRGNLGDIRVPWNDFVSVYRSDVASVVKAANDYANQKYNKAAAAFYSKKSGENN